MIAQAENVCRILTCISHPTRLLIVCMLLKSEMFVMEIVEKLGTTKGNISQHLKILLSNGLIRKRKSANKIYYSICDKNIEHVVSNLKSLYCNDFEF